MAQGDERRSRQHYELQQYSHDEPTVQTARYRRCEDVLGHIHSGARTVTYT